MTNEPNRKFDGQFSFSGGVDTLTHPLLLKENRVAFGNNVTFRGGFVGQRPGYEQKAVTYIRDSFYTWFKEKTLQGWGVYYNQNIVEAIVSVSGRIFAFDLNVLEVYERTPTNSVLGVSTDNFPAVGETIDIEVDNANAIEVGHPLYVGDYEYLITAKDGTTITIQNVDDTRSGEFGSKLVTHLVANVGFASQAWMVQAEQYFIIQDGFSAALILDGPTTRRPLSSEVPPGRQMAYGRGRLWVATGDNEVKAGDIVGGPTGILKFTENTYLSEGGSFKIPTDTGSIQAMKFINTLDDSLGQGPLIVATTGAIFSLNAPTDRDTWKDLTNPIQTYALINYGITSQYSVVAVNGDLFYRSRDGIRSFILARRDFGSWGNVPISSEMQRILKNDDDSLIKYTSAILFDNRLLFTVNPQLFRNRPYFKGIGVLDFTPISSMGQKSAPSYDGVWTGIKPVGLFKATINDRERAYAWVNNPENHLELWEISKDKEFENEDGRITSYIETGAKIFKDPYELKRLVRGELFVDQLNGDIEFTVRYKPDGSECWIEWGTITLCQQYRQCTLTDDCNEIVVYKPGYRNRLKISEPDFEEINSAINPGNHFYSVQVRIEWTGKARLLRYLLVAERTIEEIGYPDDS